MSAIEMALVILLAATLIAYLASLAAGERREKREASVAAHNDAALRVVGER